MKRVKRMFSLVLAGFLLFASPVLASQHDFEITTADANTGATFRAAVNAALQALASSSSGDAGPTATYPNQVWADTANGLLKIRNTANTAWMTVGTLADIYLGLAATFAENSFTASQQIEGSALLLRLNDTGASGEEWAIRSDGGNFEFVLNTGTESAPVWTVQARTDVNAFYVGNGTAADIDIIANNDAATKPRLRYQAGGSKWQYSNDGSTFNDMGSGGGGSSDSLPVGSLITFMGPSCPAGTVEANGTAISRTTYADLFTVIGTMYGVGDGSTTFNKPDLRGRFARGWDHGVGRDPDRTSRTNRGDGTTGDNVGTLQSHQYYSHNHTASTSMSANPAYTTSTIQITYENTGAYGGWSETPSMGSSGSGVGYPYGKTLSPSQAYLLSTSIGASGGNETRPININVLYCIKY